MVKAMCVQGISQEGKKFCFALSVSQQVQSVFSSSLVKNEAKVN